MNEKKYELPSGWTWAKLGEICSKPQYGWTTSANFNGSGIRLLRTTDISSGSIDWNKVPFCTKEPDAPQKYLLHKGDILVSRAGSVGVSFQIEECPKAIFASYLIRFKPISPFRPKFISLYFKSPYYWASIVDNIAGIAIPNVNASKLQQLDIPIPPLNEQVRIIAKIENLLDRLNKTKQELAKIPPLLKRFRQSILAKAFNGELTREWREKQKDLEPASKLLERIGDLRLKIGDLKKKKSKIPQTSNLKSEIINQTDLPELPEEWEWARLEQIVDILDSMRIPINSKERKNRKGNIPYYGANGQVGWIDNFIFDEPLVLLAEDGGFFDTWNKPNAYMIAGKSWVNNHAHVLRPCKDIEIEIVLHALNNTWLMPYVQGTTRYKLNQSTMRKILIPLPPKEEQKQITKKISDLFSQADTIEKSVKIAQAHCEKLSQSILTKAFRGELVEQYPSDGPADKLLARL